LRSSTSNNTALVSFGLIIAPLSGRQADYA
jgi:hypothetical protein